MQLAQAYEKLSLNEMALQFAGSLPPEVTGKIKRMTSYAEAGISLQPDDNQGTVRRATFSAKSTPQVASPVRHASSDATTTTRVRRLRRTQALSGRATSSESQPGLEPIESILEIPDWRHQDKIPPRPTSRQHTAPANFFGHREESEDVMRSSSIRTDTASRAQRLASLIQVRCPKVTMDPDIEIFAPRPPDISIVDRTTARDILARIRRENPKFKRSSDGLGKYLMPKQAKQNSSDIDTWTFDEHELSLALRVVVDQLGLVGVAKELIDMGADIHSLKQEPKSKVRAFISSQSNSIPYNFAKIAAIGNNVEMIHLLAARGASRDELAEALEQAVSQNRPMVVLALLQNHADPNAHDGSIFASAVASQDPALVKLLLRARQKIDKRWLTENLVNAVAQGQTEIVSLLLIYGADVSYAGASALRISVQAQRIDLVLAIVKMKVGVMGQLATSVIEDAFLSSSSLTVPEQYLLLEILLCAGATGEPVARLLPSVVRAGHRSIVELLVMHGADLQYHRAEALRGAVVGANLGILSTLLLRNIPQELASSLIDEVPHSCKDDQTYELMSVLIAKGAEGLPLDRALVRAVQGKYGKTVGLLLDHHASIMFEDSQALMMAVTSGDLGIVNLLLSKGRPQQISLQMVLPRIPQSPPQLRYEMTRSIISAAGHNGISTEILNDALLAALGQPSDEVDEGLVDLLVTAGAEVDCQWGRCFRLAAERESIELLKFLIRHRFDTALLCSAVSASMKINEQKLRRKFITTLLDYGAKGSDVDQALIAAIEERPSDKRLVRYLLEKADIEKNGGRILLAAVRCSSCDLVASIIDTGRTDRRSRLEVLPILFDPGTNNRQAMLSLLLRAGVAQQGLDNALIWEIRGEGDGDVVGRLLDHKASCQHDGGKSLELAIRSQNEKVLDLLVASHPDHCILEEMIQPAMRIKDVSSRRACLAILLRGGAGGDQVSGALLQEILYPDHQDSQLIRLLVRHGARIDYCSGKAIKHVASVPLDLDILKTLVSGTAALTVLASLVPLAMAHDQHVRLSMLEVLLKNGARGDHVHAALVTAVSEGDNAQLTIDLLLEYDASANFQEAEAVKVAALAGSTSILRCLLNQKLDPSHWPAAMRLAMQVPTSQSRPNSPRRLNCVRLLTRSKADNLEPVHSALIQSVQEKDYDLIEHLILSGADPNFRDGRSVVAAAWQFDVRSLQMLAQSNLTSEVCSRAFTAISQHPDRSHQDPELTHQLHRILISGGAKGPAVDQAFCDALLSPYVLEVEFVSMVLSCQTTLDVNFNGGAMLCGAVKRARFDIVQKLLSQSPEEKTLRAAFMSIFESDVEEASLVSMTQTFFDHSPEEKYMYFRQDNPLNDPLYQTLHRHSDKPIMLQTLLDNGCETDSKFSWIFDAQLGAEETSPLLWLLCQDDERIDERTVKFLLNSGG